MEKRKRFSQEFKLEAVRLLEAGSRPASEIAQQLGIPRNRLYKWQEQEREKKGTRTFSAAVNAPLFSSARVRLSFLDNLS